MTPAFEHFTTSVDSLIRLSEDSRIEFDDHKRMLYPSQWLYEFGTLGLTVPRRVGKTSYIAKRAACADLVVARSEMLKRDQYRDTCATVMTVDQLVRGFGGRFAGSTLKFNRIWFDDSWGMLSLDQQDEVYYFFSGQHPSRACANMFIMLGTRG
jgi:hypothetical protein